MLSQAQLHEMADLLFEAERTLVPVAPLTATYPELDEEHAYSVQVINAGRAVRAGRRQVGYKIGLTSREAQRQFKISQPDYGHLFDSMAVLEDGEIDLSTLIQPKIESEIAFVLGKDLKGPSVTIVDALDAVEYAVAALEIVDSRIRDWKISAADTIADNGSSALFVLSGHRRRLDGLDLPSVGMALHRNGEVMVTGAGAAVMGNPLSAVVFLANELGRLDKPLLAGEVILSGALSSMITVQPGDAYLAEFGGLGKVGVRFGTKKNESAEKRRNES